MLRTLYRVLERGYPTKVMDLVEEDRTLVVLIAGWRKHSLAGRQMCCCLSISQW